MGLACSLTAEYDKIAEDATKVVKNYPDVRVLVFATPGEVTKHKEKKWAEDLRKEFGLDLVVMPREDLITSLIQPWNADICRAQLGIHILGKPQIQSIAARAREAVAEVIDSWVQRPGLSGRPLIDLDAESRRSTRATRAIERRRPPCVPVSRPADNPRSSCRARKNDHSDSNCAANDG